MSLLDWVKFCESYNRFKIGKSHCSNTAKSKILVTPGSNILIANDFPISEIQNNPLDLIVIIIIEIDYTEKLGRWMKSALTVKGGQLGLQPIDIEQNHSNKRPKFTESTSIYAISEIKCQLNGLKSTYTTWSSTRNHVSFLMKRTLKESKYFHLYQTVTSARKEMGFKRSALRKYIQVPKTESLNRPVYWP